MERSEVVQRYPDLGGLYVPETGEIIEWGTGNAIVVDSPLDSKGGSLLAISFNSKLSGIFEVTKQLGMGPYERISIKKQEEMVEYWDRNFGLRVSRLFSKFPEAKEAWEKYRQEKVKGKSKYSIFVI